MFSYEKELTDRRRLMKWFGRHNYDDKDESTAQINCTV